jgi:hypothetical protein
MLNSKTIIFKKGGYYELQKTRNFGRKYYTDGKLWHETQWKAM